MKKTFFRVIPGGITAAQGFLASGLHAGIKKQEAADLALVYSPTRAVTAAAFTTNQVVASSIEVSREHLRDGFARAVIINSGNANACTGRRGYRDTLEITRRTAQLLKLDCDEVCMASTGVIGQPLPMDNIRKALPTLIQRLRPEGGHEAALAIMTTDTFVKQVAVRARIGGREVTIGGMAKGSGMIAPDMATMLCFIGTDMKIGKTVLQGLLRQVVAESFNRITVDGDTSTNDMVMCLANGAAGNSTDAGSIAKFKVMLRHVAIHLAKQIARDGEGATKFVEVRISGTRSISDAVRAGKAIANSNLVKTTFFGEDPNWGRIMAALGYSGASVKEERVRIAFDDVTIVRRGMGLGPEREAQAKRVMKKRDFVLKVDLGLGKGVATLWTSDLTYDYVKINVGYRS